MKLNEIEKEDDGLWRLISVNGHTFYIDYEYLKDRYSSLFSNYNSSTLKPVVKGKLDKLEEMQAEIIKMKNFCKNIHPSSEVEGMLKSLRTMYNGCELMIEDLERFL
jgi:hypothetical protein